MTYSTVSAHTGGNLWPSEYGASGTLGIFCTRDFVADDGKSFQQGEGTSLTQQFVTTATITVAANIPTYGSFTLPKTDIATPVDARYMGYIFDANGVQRGLLFGPYDMVSSLGDAISYLAWVNDNAQTRRYPTDTGPTTTQMNLAIAGALTGVVPSSTTLKGISKSSTTPTDSANPVHIESSDPKVIADQVASVASIRTLGPGALQARSGGGVYNVRDYLAVGDGVTNDLTAFRNAIAAAEAAGGGTVLIPQGNFFLSATTGTELLLITKPIVFAGSAGWNSRIIIGASVGASIDWIRVSPAEDIGASYWLSQSLYFTFRNFNMYSASGTPGRYGILFDTQLANQYISRAVVEDIQMANPGTACIASLNAVGDVNGTASLTIRRNQFRGGLYLRPIGDALIIDDNAFGGVGSSLDIEQYPGAAGFVFSRNVVTNTGGFRLRMAYHPIIRDNYFEVDAGTGASGKLVNIEGTTAFHIISPVFVGNSVVLLTGIVEDGLNFDYVDGGSIHNNWFNTVDAGNKGITITSNTTSVVYGVNNFAGAGTGLSDLGANTVYDLTQVTNSNIGGLTARSTSLSYNVTGGRGLLELQGGNGGASENVGTISFYNNTTELAQITSSTDGAANSGQITFRTMNAGSSAIRVTIDKTGISTFAESVLAKSVRGTAVAFASLPASPVEGMMVAVTDSNTNTWGATIAGGGANHVLAFFNGTVWTVAGK